MYSQPSTLNPKLNSSMQALLYMVCEELLVSAHESGDDHVWWIDLQVYLGFMFSLVLNKAFMMNGGLVQTFNLSRRM